MNLDSATLLVGDAEQVTQLLQILVSHVKMRVAVVG